MVDGHCRALVDDVPEAYDASTPMTTPSAANPIDAPGRHEAAPNLLSIYLELGKARLSALVVFTTMVGYVLASPGAIDWVGLGLTTLGTALCAWAANALNQWMEWSRDARMQRTRSRPLPQNQISLQHAFAAAITSAVLGTTVLWLTVNALSAVLAVATILIYVLAYTPLKVRSTLNTLVGAVVGAIPPMIGWAGATGRLDAGAWILGAVLLVWQIPHFLSLAWMYREDYQRGGFRMLPAVDPDGRLTGQVIVAWSLALVPVTVGLTLAGATGWWYAAGSAVLGGWLVWRSLGLRKRLNRATARRVFLASVIYLPLLLGLMMLDRATSADDSPATVRQVEPGPVVPAERAGHNRDSVSLMDPEDKPVADRS
jgi:protoheme IX farnesyltransferase